MILSIVISLFSASMLVTCSQAQKMYIIEGIVPDKSYDNQIVYMYDYETREPVDSVFVVDGKFTFDGVADTAVIRLLIVNRLQSVIIPEKGKIFVDMANPQSIKGTPLNNELSKYISGMDYYWDREQINMLSSRFFNENKNNALGIYVLLRWSTFLEPDKFDLMYSQAGDIVQKSAPLQNIVETNESNRQTVGKNLFADFIIENGNIDGSRVSLSDYVGKGKYVLVDFWASWCGPCIAEKPVLIEVYDKYKGDKFEILGVAVWEERERTKKYLEEHNSPWPQIIGAGYIPGDLYGLSGIPHIILFAPDGTIVARELRGKILKAKVNEVMQ